MSDVNTKGQARCQLGRLSLRADRRSDVETRIKTEQRNDRTGGSVEVVGIEIDVDAAHRVNFVGANRGHTVLGFCRTPSSSPISSRSLRLRESILASRRSVARIRRIDISFQVAIRNVVRLPLRCAATGVVGTQQATMPTSSITMTDPPNTTGSLSVARYTTFVSTWPATSASISPAIIPMATIAVIRARTSCTTLRAVAPSATRMPISSWRRATA